MCLISPYVTDWQKLFRTNLKFAKKSSNTLTREQLLSLKTISRDFRLTLLGGEVRLIGWKLVRYTRRPDALV